MLNRMCLDCKKLNNGCNGTECQTWTGCVYKEKLPALMMADQGKEGYNYGRGSSGIVARRR